MPVSNNDFEAKLAKMNALPKFFILIFIYVNNDIN